ncbi:MAG: bifunctional 5,10-methylene-tetrahydrofolate dehydrogenase/5,10-methylene-tetrahydrofolate cyclohydrolase, partial [Bacteroidia bacterium]|nr:bifunctional 5,10-methylene-tetrahydrofolate dehydrogenase/5,10-methylene-tetrahydrofolate cyclohydrolase [Bacteroidia bacterium]
MILLDGKTTSKEVKDEIAETVKKLKSEGKKTPHLAAVLVGSDGASMTYVNSKVKACELVGFKSTLIKLEASISEETLLAEIDKLNTNDDIDGFIVQLPLPKHIDEQKVIMAVHPDKDVDGFHPINVGKMTLDLPSFISATPYGIL